MDLLLLRDLLQNYPLNSFIGTPKTILINQGQLNLDIKSAFSEYAEKYLSNLSDLISHNRDYFSDNLIDFSNYLSRLIGTTSALRDMIQIGEENLDIFVDEFAWSRSLAFRAMVTILDNMLQELIIARNQAKSSRLINRVRDKISFLISQKIPQMFYILTTLIAIDLKQVSPSEIVSAIGKGMQTPQVCR